MTATRPGPRTSRGPRATGAALLRVPGHSGAAMGEVSIEMLIQQGASENRSKSINFINRC